MKSGNALQIDVDRFSTDLGAVGAVHTPSDHHQLTVDFRFRPQLRRPHHDHHVTLDLSIDLGISKNRHHISLYHSVHCGGTLDHHGIAVIGFIFREKIVREKNRLRASVMPANAHVHFRRLRRVGNCHLNRRIGYGV